MRLGLSGWLTRTFIRSPLTPLLLLASLVVGTVALLSLPREEEPQISVPMVDVHVRADGLRADDAVELVTKPLEEIVKAIDGVEHVYSQTVDDGAVVTARFVVGTPSDNAILRVHEKLRANYDRMPLGIPEPLVVGRGIDDVAILTLTLFPRAEAAAHWDDNALWTAADRMLAELVKTEDVGLTYIVGGRPDQIRVEPDPERLALAGVTLNQLVEKVRNANRSFQVGQLRSRGGSLPAVAGQTLQGVPDIGLLLLTTRDGRPVYVKDVADVIVGARPEEARAWHMTPDGRGGLVRVPAVTIAVAKRAGANAVVIADHVLERLHALRSAGLPQDLEVAVTRNYGETADEKVDELLFHLALATLSIVLLVAAAIGWREGAVVFVVIPTTILLTMFASWAMGYTINRVSLFALIFSIGILVDDAIVVVENIHRHRGLTPDAPLSEIIPRAVDEVGGPTILATFTVIAALLPMAFVSGLMGPYMSPIPINASMGMAISLAIAFTVTPWLALKLMDKGPHAPPLRGSLPPEGAHSGLGAARRPESSDQPAHGPSKLNTALQRLFTRVLTPFLQSARKRWLLLAGIIAALLLSVGLTVVQWVV
ncbi:MAG: efflux RND transporter permease subunit, partial [Alphaproteobacteria bacterium]